MQSAPLQTAVCALPLVEVDTQCSPSQHATSHRRSLHGRNENNEHWIFILSLEMMHTVQHFKHVH